MTKPLKRRIRISLDIQIEGSEGMDDFARMLRVLHDNGYQETVKRLTRMLVAAAKKHGAEVPAELERFNARGNDVSQDA